MPKNRLRPFARRKSSGNILDYAPDETPGTSSTSTSSFRVLDRADKGGVTADEQPSEAPPVKRPFTSPLHNFRGRSAEELGSGLNRGSGQTTTTSHSGSSGYYDSSVHSARHSSSSTIPSSFDAEQEAEDEGLFVHRVKTAPMAQAVPSQSNEQPAPPPPAPSFTARAARALSFGSRNAAKGAVNNNERPPIPSLPPDIPRNPERSYSPQRDRAMTTSSYASTAKPDMGLTLGSADFGTDFSTMFEPTGKSPNPNGPLPPSPGFSGTHRTDSPPIFPPRAHSDQPSSRPVNAFRGALDGPGSPYSFEATDAYEALLSANSPKMDDFPPVPAHKMGIASGFLGGQAQGYSLVNARGDSPDFNRARGDSPTQSDSDQPLGLGLAYRNRQTQLDDGDRWIKRVELHDGPVRNQDTSGSFSSGRKQNGFQSQVNHGMSRANTMSPASSEGTAPLWGAESRNTTPRAGASRRGRGEDSLFNSSPTVPPSRAIRPNQMQNPIRNGASKTMTKAEFDQLQRSGENSTEQSDDEEPEDDYEDEDETDRARQMAKQRQRQEANMSVYRQQMKKVTGGGPADLPATTTRPSLDRASQSAPATASLGSFHLGGASAPPPPSEAIRPKDDDDDDDDDVPLGILQAHGFPNAGRPPTRATENEISHQRRASASGSVIGGGAGQGNLPPFARRLPADPYFGSSVVNPTNREGMGMSTTGGSVYSAAGGGPQMMGQMPPLPTMQSMPSMPSQGHPAGLVGVIAGEERAKAARRGSPNPTTGTYNPAPLPSNMNYQTGGMPSMGGRTMSMGNLQVPQAFSSPGMMMPGMMPQQMPGMPMMPMPGMPMQPQMPGMPQMNNNNNNDQMQQFMAMQMQVMQNMLTMQQQQMGLPPSAQLQQPQTQDYLGAQHHLIPPNQNPQIAPSPSPGPLQGRAMTMMNPPKDWETSQNVQRPQSAMPHGSNLSMSGPYMSAGGPGPGYTPSIAPSERSNVGMPSRYRPVTSGGEVTGRTQSMTSLTPPAFATRKSTPELLPPSNLSQPPQATSTIRLVEKPKGAPRVNSKPVAAATNEDDDDDGWADMKKKRQDRMTKFKFGKKSSKAEIPLGELYPNVD